MFNFPSMIWDEEKCGDKVKELSHYRKRMYRMEKYMENIDKYLNFIIEAEGLKSVLRTAWTTEGRQESTAEHSWRLTLLAAIFLNEYPKLDKEKVYLMCVIHDMGELYDGDIPAVVQGRETEKYEIEYKAIKKVFALLPDKLEQKMLEIWEEYYNNSSEEAHLVKALDKAETIIQHNQGKNPENFDYLFNLQYGDMYFKEDKRLEELRVRLNEETRKHI